MKKVVIKKDESLKKLTLQKSSKSLTRARSPSPSKSPSKSLSNKRMSLPMNFDKIENKNKVKKFKYTVSPESKVKAEVMKQRINDFRLYSGKWTIPKITEKKTPKKKKIVNILQRQVLEIEQPMTNEVVY